MCEWGDTVNMKVPVPAELSHTGKMYWAERGIDRCIAPIIEALNNAGVYTANCCCGHGKNEGTIHLHDGRIIHLGNYDLKASLCNQEDDNDPLKVIDVLLNLERGEWDELNSAMNEKSVSPLDILREWYLEQYRMNNDDIITAVESYELKHEMTSVEFARKYRDVDYRIEHFDGEDGFDFHDWNILLDIIRSKFNTSLENCDKLSKYLEV